MKATGAIATLNRGIPFSSRHLHAIGFWLLSLILFWRPLTGLASLSFHDERSSHILLIPVISACLIYFRRSEIFRGSHYCPAIGVPILVGAGLLWFSLRTWLAVLSDVERLSAFAAILILVWMGGFILFYGALSFRAAMFPLLFLVLMIPLPAAVAEYVAVLLQRGSTEACYGLFRLLQIPLIRHGFVFSLPGVDIQVGEQCSGIHSGLSLFIAGLVAQHILIRGGWKKAFFIACIFPIAVIKNAVRIVTISWLGMHFSPDFFNGPLHRQGGLPFSLLAVAMMAIVLWFLTRPYGLSRMRS